MKTGVNAMEKYANPQSEPRSESVKGPGNLDGSRKRHLAAVRSGRMYMDQPGDSGIRIRFEKDEDSDPVFDPDPFRQPHPKLPNEKPIHAVHRSLCG